MCLLWLIPDPEIAYDLAVASRPDVIVATGRSDYPNQINNVIGFPYIFRGALDCGATGINEAMKIAAVHAIADLAKEPVPSVVDEAYGMNNIKFGRDYILPKALDPRLLLSGLLRPWHVLRRSRELQNGLSLTGTYIRQNCRA